MAKVETTEAKWVTPVAIIGGGGMLAVGAYLIFKRPKGIKVGEKFKVIGKVKHKGIAKKFFQQCALGHLRLLVLDEVEGLKWKTDFYVDTDTDWAEYPIKMECGPIPTGAKPGVYDAEFSIREDGIYQGQRVIIKGALRIIE